MNNLEILKNSALPFVFKFSPPQIVQEWTTDPFIKIPIELNPQSYVYCIPKHLKMTFRSIFHFRYTVQCVLPINLFNEKIFLFLWFWIFFLTVMNLSSFMHWCSKLLILPMQVCFFLPFFKSIDLLQLQIIAVWLISLSISVPFSPCAGFICQKATKSHGLSQERNKNGFKVYSVLPPERWNSHRPTYW